MQKWAVLIVVLGMLAGRAAWGAQAVPVQGETAVPVEDFSYPDDRTAQGAWQAMWGTANVTLTEIEGRRALRMPCNFRGTTIERAVWDRGMRLDMTGCQSVRFRFYCRDRSPVAHFSIYFQSGDGWYASGFAPTQRDGWSTIVIDKEDTQIEGSPSGWGQVRTIRISAWRGRDVDTEFAVADLALAGAESGICIVRGESVMRRSDGETEVVCQFSQSVARFLKDLGLGYSLMSDLDLTPARLKDKRLVILPHNPGMPDEAAGAVARFAAGGGKLLVFYALPEKLREFAAVEGAGHVPQKYAGYFSSIRFVEDRPPGIPAAVNQGSWNINAVKPIQGRGRVLGWWHDKDGNSTGYPAVVASEQCMYVTHVLLNDDRPNKRRMLLGMIGQLVPEFWRQSVTRTIESIGQIGPYSSFEQARREIEAAAEKGAAAQALGRAEKRRSDAVSLSAQGKFAEAMTAAEESRGLLTEAYCLIQKAQSGEHRAFWCHSAFGPA